MLRIRSPHRIRLKRLVWLLILLWSLETTLFFISRTPFSSLYAHAALILLFYLRSPLISAPETVSIDELKERSRSRPVRMTSLPYRGLFAFSAAITIRSYLFLLAHIAQSTRMASVNVPAIVLSSIPFLLIGLMLNRLSRASTLQLDPAPAIRHRLVYIASCYCVGLLAWNLLTRCSGLDFTRAAAVFIASVCTLFASTIAVLHPLPTSVCEGSDHDNGLDPVLTLPPEVKEVLTKRELEVINLILLNKSSQEAAQLLGIKPSTVREYLGRSYRKLGIKNLTELKDAYQSHSPTAESNPHDTRRRLLEDLLIEFSFTACLLPLFIAFDTWGAGQRDLLALSLGILIGSVLRSPGACVTRSNARSLLALCCMALIFLLRIAVAVDDMTCFILIAIAGAGMTCLLPQSTLQAPISIHADTPHVTAYSFSIILGIACEEIWRGRYWFSFAPAASTFLVVAAFSFPILFLPRCTIKKGTLICEALIFFLLLHAAPSYMQTVILAIALVNIVVSTAFSRFETLRTSIADVFPGISLGIILGVIGGNKIADLFTHHVDILGVYGSQTGLELSTVFISALLFCGSAFFFLFQFRHARNTWLQTQRACKLAGNDRAIIDYLTACGLNTLQANVAVNIAQGYTSTQTASRLNYSIGAVNKARYLAYKKLGVSNANALQSLILAGITCSQTDSGIE